MKKCVVEVLVLNQPNKCYVETDCSDYYVNIYLVSQKGTDGKLAPGGYFLPNLGSSQISL